MKRDDLMRHDASGVTVQWYPKSYRAAGIEMALTYHFEPGSPRDGVTLAVPILRLTKLMPCAASGWCRGCSRKR